MITVLEIAIKINVFRLIAFILMKITKNQASLILKI